MSPDSFKRKWIILAAVSTSAFMGTIDASIVNIALPTLSSEFSIDVKTVSLVSISYLLVVTSFLIVGGKAGDFWGRKKVFVTGISIFTVGSLLCGLAPSFSFLVGGRIVQAIGGAMLAGNSSALVTDSFPQSERGKALGIIGTVVSVGLTIGPPLGGLIIEYIGWRYIFWVNIPLGIAAVLVCIKTIPKDKPDPEHPGLDIPGAILLPLLLLSLIVGINFLGNGGLGNTNFIILLFAFLAFTALFYRFEKRSEYPLIDFGLLFRKRFFFSNIAGFVSYFSMIFVIILLPFYNEEILGLSAGGSGRILLTLPLTTMFLAPLAGTISDKIGQRVLASAGLIIASFGFYLLIGLESSGTVKDVVLRLVVIGIGFGIFTTPNNSAIMGAVPIAQRGLASGMLATVRNLGMSLGVATSTSLFTLWKNSLLNQDLNYQSAFMQSLHRVLLIAIAVLLVGVIFSLLRGEEPE